MSSACIRDRKLLIPVPPGINMHPGYMRWVEFRSHARPAICFKLQTTINPCIITATTGTEAMSTQPLMLLQSSSNNSTSPQCRKSQSIYIKACFSLAVSASLLQAGTFQVFSVSFLPAAETEKPPPRTSLHRAGGAAAGLDPGSANVQPGQLGTVLKELLDGDVTHMQL